MFELPPITTELLASLIDEKKVEDLRYIFDEINEVDLADAIAELSKAQALFIFKTISKEITAVVFSYLPIDKQEELVEAFSGPQIKTLLESAHLDDVVDFLEEMPDQIVRKVLQNATESQRSEINILLSYKENSAGTLLTTRYVELDENDSVATAMSKVRKQGKSAEAINTCYVINQQNRLIGTVTIKDIMVSNEDVSISELMETDIVWVNTKDDREDVVKVFSRYDLSIVPVVNDQFCLVGIITADDVIDVIEEEATEDIHLMAAIRPLEGSYLKTSGFDMFKSRIPWLLVLMISATFTGSIISYNDNLLILLPSLVNFIPMLMDTAGNAGSQASAMVIRGIVVDGLSVADFYKVLFKELRSSLLTGLVLFVVNTTRILIFMPEIGWPFAVMVSLSVYVTIILANLIGGSLPLLALVFKIDPAAMSGPVITTIVDAIALVVYFGIATNFLL